MMSTRRDVRPPRAKRPTHVAHKDLLVGPMSAIPSILAERGIEPALVLAEVGLAPGLFDHPENRMSYAALARLLETCVKRTSCQHFGLLIGQRFTMDSLGVLGSLMRNSPTLRDALRMATTHLELQDRGSISVAVDLGDSRSALGYTVFTSNLPAAVQILDGAIAIHCQILRQLCGPSWKPALVQLSHRRPAKIAPFHELLRPKRRIRRPDLGDRIRFAVARSSRCGRRPDGVFRHTQVYRVHGIRADSFFRRTGSPSHLRNDVYRFGILQESRTFF